MSRLPELQMLRGSPTRSKRIATGSRTGKSQIPALTPWIVSAPSAPCSPPTHSASRHPLPLRDDTPNSELQPEVVAGVGGCPGPSAWMLR
jgi:hypothetical protein